MKLFGHNWLRSNFKPGDPVRLTAAALQTNFVANVLKYCQGYGCSIRKPTMAAGDGWVWDMTSTDIPPPDGATSPWAQMTVDQFRVNITPDQYKVFVGWGAPLGVKPTEGCGEIAWPSYTEPPTIPTGTLSEPRLYTGDDALTEWLWWCIFDYGGAGQAMGVFVTTTALPPSGLVPDYDFAGLICKVEYDPAVVPKIVLTTAGSVLVPSAPITKDAFKVRGGVWQYMVGTETKVIKPEDGGVTWPAVPAADTTDCEDYWSRIVDGAGGGKLWAKLDLSSVTPKLTLELLTVDPTWADNIYFNKIATVGVTVGATPEQTTLKVHQHHAGSIDVAVGGSHPVGSAWLTGAEDTTLSVTPEALDFTAGYTSNAALLTYDTSANSITVKKKGIYTITLGARLKVQVTAIPTTSNNYVSASVKVNGTASGDIPALYLEEKDIAASYGSTGYLKLRECNSFDIALAANDVITASVFGTDTSQLSEGRLTVRLVHLQS